MRTEKIDAVTAALRREGIPFTYSVVKGYCGEVHLYQQDIHDRIRIEIISEIQNVQSVKDILLQHGCCGLEGDGCLSVYHLEDFIKFTGSDQE